jgi:hypothetical protein
MTGNDTTDDRSLSSSEIKRLEQEGSLSGYFKQLQQKFKEERRKNAEEQRVSVSYETGLQIQKISYPRL